MLANQGHATNTHLRMAGLKLAARQNQQIPFVMERETTANTTPKTKQSVRAYRSLPIGSCQQNPRAVCNSPQKSSADNNTVKIGENSALVIKDPGVVTPGETELTAVAEPNDKQGKDYYYAEITATTRPRSYYEQGKLCGLLQQQLLNTSSIDNIVDSTNFRYREWKQETVCIANLRKMGEEEISSIFSVSIARDGPNINKIITEGIQELYNARKEREERKGHIQAENSLDGKATTTKRIYEVLRDFKVGHLLARSIGFTDEQISISFTNCPTRRQYYFRLARLIVLSEEGGGLQQVPTTTQFQTTNNFEVEERLRAIVCNYRHPHLLRILDGNDNFVSGKTWRKKNASARSIGISVQSLMHGVDSRRKFVTTGKSTAYKALKKKWTVVGARDKRGLLAGKTYVLSTIRQYNKKKEQSKRSVSIANSERPSKKKRK